MSPRVGDGLLAEWAATLQRLGGRPDPQAPRRLLARYAEPHRHYHDTGHLVGVLAAVDELAAFAADPDMVRLAAWYHDAVYDPRRSDNEGRSAALAELELGAAGMPATTVERVTRLVHLTASHEPGDDDRDGHVLCDADLAILAAAPAAYARYVAAVRREYHHVSPADWRIGRRAVLTPLLTRPRLFRTAAADSWHAPARRNINRELAALGDPSDGADPPR